MLNTMIKRFFGLPFLSPFQSYSKPTTITHCGRSHDVFTSVSYLSFSVTLVSLFSLLVICSGQLEILCNYTR